MVGNTQGVGFMPTTLARHSWFESSHASERREEIKMEQNTVYVQARHWWQRPFIQRGTLKAPDRTIRRALKRIKKGRNGVIDSESRIVLLDDARSKRESFRGFGR